MMEENNSRKVFLSVLGVAILVVAVVGISYAAFFFMNQSAQDNTITTGTITMSYSEPANGLSLTNELPLAVGEGIERAQHFDFTVSTTTTGIVNIPYEINITPTFTTSTLSVTSATAGTTPVPSNQEACEAAGGSWAASTCTAPTLTGTLTGAAALNAAKWVAATNGEITATGYEPLPEENIRIYLTDGSDAGLALNAASAIASSAECTAAGGSWTTSCANGNARLVSQLPTETATDLRSGSLRLLTSAHNHTVAGTQTSAYRLRMWIDSATDVTQWIPNVTYRYALKVNVDSHVNPLS